MKRILILEDDQGIREVLEILLTSENYNVQSFESIAAFLIRDTSELPDLYLFDVMLPDGSGIDLCSTLNQNAENVKIPVMIMSAHADVNQLKGVCKPEDFISKPFDIDYLLSRVKYAVNQSADHIYQ